MVTVDGNCVEVRTGDSSETIHDDIYLKPVSVFDWTATWLELLITMFTTGGALWLCYLVGLGSGMDLVLIGLMILSCTGALRSDVFIVGRDGRSITGRYKPLAPQSALKRILARKELIGRLGPPGSRDVADKRRYVPRLDRIGLEKVFFAMLSLSLMALLFDGPVIPCLMVVFVWSARLTRQHLLEERADSGVHAFGDGQGNAGKRYRFEDVERVSVEFDTFLQAPFLNLEIGGETIRYYNPTDDVLYLLRLVKYRMPGVLQDVGVGDE